MILVVGVKDIKMRDFLIANNLILPNVIVIDKMCTLKNIKSSVDVIIPFGYITDADLISNTLVHIPELLMMLNVNSILYYNSYNENRLKKLANDFNVKLIKG